MMKLTTKWVKYPFNFRNRSVGIGIVGLFILLFSFPTNTSCNNNNLFTGISVNQQRSISGKVTDETSGDALPGVNVLVQGTLTGTITDIDGNFSLSLPANSTTLVFSFIGYTTQIVLIKGLTSINVSLKPESIFLDEIVVVGYGVQKKSHLTGSVSKIKNDRLDEIPVSRIDQALQGKIAGVQIQNTTSEAGVAPKIRIRGMGSISATSSPLVVVDGHPVADGLSFVSMADVESIEVLKDAASSAIYGSRGAAGVIMITTKSGNAEKPKYDFKISKGILSAYKLQPLMTFSEYTRKMYDEAALRANDPSVPVTSRNLTTNGERACYIIENEISGGQATNWQDEAIRNIGTLDNYQLSVSGGKKDLTYYISGNYQNEDGLMYHSFYKKMSLRTKVNGQLGKRIKFGINLNPSYSKQEIPSVNYTDFYRWYSYFPVYHTATTAAWANQNTAWANIVPGDWTQARHFNGQAYKGTMPDGTLWDSSDPLLALPNGGKLDPWSTSNNTPKSIMETNSKMKTGYRMMNSGDLSINLMKGLDFRASGSAYLSYSESTNLSMKNSKKDGDPSTRLFQTKMDIDLLSENTLNYNLKIGDHEIGTLLGFTAQSTQAKYTGISGSGFASDAIETLNSATQLDISKTNTLSETIRLLSYLGRINYSYKDKYLLSASYRRDGSSYFSPGHKWGNFPSLSVGWVVSNEGFMKSLDWLSLFKLRTSYGATGNNRISSFAYTNLLNSAGYSFGSGTGQNVLGLSPSGDVAGNNLITWERTFEYNLGFDLNLFKNKVSISGEFYQSETDHLLFSQSAISISGYNTFWNNIGKVRNQGVELELTTTNIYTPVFSWKTSFNIASNTNELLELGGEPFQYSYGERNEIYAAIVGQPSIQFFGYKTNGVWTNQAEMDAAKLEDQGTNVSKYFTLGGLKTVDINNDGKITADDRTPLGNPFPKFTWGLSNNFTYRNFDLSFLFVGVRGNKIINGDANYNEARKFNKNFNTSDRWVSEMYPGDGKTPYFTNGQDWMLTDYVIEDGSYMALRELSIGYELPVSISKVLHLSSSRIYVSGQNLFYLTAKGYRGINPESRYTSGNYASPLIDGYTRGGFPVARTISFGLDINF